MTGALLSRPWAEAFQARGLNPVGRPPEPALPTRDRTVKKMLFLVRCRPLGATQCYVRNPSVPDRKKARAPGG